MKKIMVVVFLLISSVCSAQNAVASQLFTGKCLLEINGTKYIDGQCEISMNKDGSFQIIKAGYFASVNIEEKNIASGYWNEEKGARHAHSPLGDLTRKGACWQNSTSKVCAWK